MNKINHSSISIMYGYGYGYGSGSGYGDDYYEYHESRDQALWSLESQRC